jgi:hypothetical protein
MKKLISRQCLALLVLLCSATGFAASVTIVPSTGNPAVGQNFFIDVFGSGFPATAGATLILTFNANVELRTPTLTNGVKLGSGSPFTDGIGMTPDCEEFFASGCSFSVLAPLGGTPPSGDFGGFAAVRIGFKALAVGDANIRIFDDQNDFSWTDATTSLPIPVTYNQANVNVAPIPVPAAVWLFGSALGVMGWLRRKAAS